eukprot:scaffold147590_cov16-Tisochrysis_lutea.AAC.1
MNMRDVSIVYGGYRHICLGVKLVPGWRLGWTVFGYLKQNQCIEVVDCSTMQAVGSMPDAHARPVHTIVQQGNAAKNSAARKNKRLSMPGPAACCGIESLLLHGSLCAPLSS